MSKQTKQKISSEVTNGNSKDSRRPSVFDRLGSRSLPFSSSAEGICKAWVQNGSCPYGKSCKYSNSHIVLSPLKRNNRKEIDFQGRSYKERGAKSPDDTIDKWDSSDLECVDEKVLEKRLILLQRELEKQMKGEEDRRSAYSSNKHVKTSGITKKCSKKVGRSPSSESSDSSSSDSSSSTAESSSTSSSDSVHRKHSRVPGKNKRRSTSSFSDEHISKKIKYSKTVKGKSPVMNRRQSRSPIIKKLSSPSSKKSSKLSPVSRTVSKHNRHAFTPPTEKCKSPPRKHSPRLNKHSSVEHRDKHRSVSPSMRNQRERDYDKSRDRVRSKSPKSKGRTVTPCRRNDHQKIIKKKESPEKLRTARLTPEKHIITRKISPARNRQAEIRTDEKRRDDKLRGLKDDHRRMPTRINQEKREDDRLRERRAREVARERERREALERCQERQRQRELAKVKAEREKEKVRESDRSKERVREPDRRAALLKDRVRLPDREEKTIRVRERSFERTVSAKIKLNDSYNRDDRNRTAVKSRERGRSYDRDQLSVDKERVSLKDRNLERILVHDQNKSLERRGSHERSIVRDRVFDKERDCSLSRNREVEGRRVLSSDDKGFDSPFRARDERAGRYLNEGDERSHFKDSPVRDDARQLRLHSDERRRDAVGGRNSWEDKRPGHDWDTHRDWDPRVRRGGLHVSNDGWDRRRKVDGEDWGRYSKEWNDREWRKDWMPRNVQAPPLPVTREESTSKNAEDTKSADSKKKADLSGPLEEELSDISDEADEILCRDDAGGDRSKVEISPKISPDTKAKDSVEDDLLKIAPKKYSLNKMLSSNGTSALQDSLEDSYKTQGKEGLEQLDFEEISDEELEDEARTRITLGDALGVDWASLIAETRPKPRFDAEPGSAKRRWESANLIERLGVSVRYAGSDTINKLLDKYNNCFSDDHNMKKSDEFRTKVPNSDSNDTKVNGEKSETYANSSTISFLHPVAGIHVALRERQQKRRTLFNSINRALSARSDIALRRQLCGLPVRNIQVQQATGFYQWVV